MSSKPRQKTKYPGVFFREGIRIGGGGSERIYYVVFKLNGKTMEEKVGRQYQDAMTPAKASHIRAELIEGRRNTKRRIKELKLMKVWNFQELWEEYAKSKVRNRSFINDEVRFQKYIMPTLGDKQPCNLVPLDIERVKLSMKKQTKAPQTVKHVLALIKRIANFGANHGICGNLQFKIIMPVVDNKTTEDLSPEELLRLMEAIEDDPNRAVATMMKLALYTGMRKGEIFKLQWEDINFHRGFILIRHPKGGTSQEIPLNSEAEKLFREWVKTPGSSYVFPGKNGGQRATITVAANRIKRAAGLPENFRPMHGLRHVYASMLASSGKVDMYTLQKLLTHKSPVMTQRYAHLRDDALKRAADLAGEIVGSALAQSTADTNVMQGGNLDAVKSGK